MLDIFGEGHTALKVLFFLIVVLVLFVLGVLAVRRFGGGQLGSSAGRGRQPRLGVIDSLAVDGRRRLVLIRRDNVEHLLVIGGPTDVVVEQNIVRAAGAPREAPAARAPAAGETLPRAVPMNEGSMWPLQPEPATPRPELARPEPPRLEQRPQRQVPVVEEPAQWQPEPEAPPPPPLPPVVQPPRERARPRVADPLAGLAEELGRSSPMTTESTAMDQRPIEPTLQPPAEPPMRQVEPPVRQPPRRVPRPAAPPPPIPQSPVPQSLAPQVAAPSAPDAEFSSAADQNLAEMAQRLEAALRRPAKPEDRPAPPASPNPRTAPAADETGELPAPPARAAPPPPRPARAEMARATRPDAKPAAPQKSLYDSLEQEMASLLGRPNEKT